nr:hypothetical protein Itr_chr14CG06240 [Ipomoea trifida]
MAAELGGEATALVWPNRASGELLLQRIGLGSGGGSLFLQYNDDLGCEAVWATSDPWLFFFPSEVAGAGAQVMPPSAAAGVEVLPGFCPLLGEAAPCFYNGGR